MSNGLTLIQAQDYSWVYFTADTSLSLDEKELLIRERGAVVQGTSKWLHASCIEGSGSAFNLLSIVDRIEPLRRYKVTRNQIEETAKTAEDFKYGGSDWQLQMLGLDEYHKQGYTGKGVTIGLFDAGFFRVDSLEAFDSMRRRGQIKAVWDFFYNDTNVYIQDGHGMYVLSIAGGYWPDSIMGAAPDANFLLARTEIANREIKAEELAWVKALEWADSIGVDIIHSSLGYSEFDTLEGDYVYQDMDGQTTVVTKATDIAASKGIFVTNSAGNEGEKDWHYITAPCDGRYVLCVGAVDSNEVHAPFSSYGPSADGRVKPDVVAMGKGVTYVTKEGDIKTGGGTSFSGPLIAGMVACLKQAWPMATNEHMYQAIIRSSDRYDNPDTAYGFGLPNVQKADSILAIFSKVESVKHTDTKIFPNPGTHNLYIESTNDLDQIVVRDLMGRLVVQQEVQMGIRAVKIPILQLHDGNYTVEISFVNGQIGRHRFMKID